MHRPAAQEATLDKSPHTSGCMAKLIIMPYCYLELLFACERDQFLGLVFIKCEWFLHIDVFPCGQGGTRR